MNYYKNMNNYSLLVFKCVVIKRVVNIKGITTYGNSNVSKSNNW